MNNVVDLFVVAVGIALIWSGLMLMSYGFIIGR